MCGTIGLTPLTATRRFLLADRLLTCLPSTLPRASSVDVASLRDEQVGRLAALSPLLIDRIFFCHFCFA